MSGSQSELLLVGCFTLLCWLVAALMVKPLQHLWQRREEYWFANRHPSATWIIIAGTLLYITISRPLEVLHQYFSLGHDTEDAAFISGFVYQTLNAPIYYSVAFAHCTRYWIMYFDIEIAVRCSDQRWKELLLTAPQTDCQHAFDWFTAHKLTLGNWNYLKKVGAVLVVVLFCATVVIYWTANKYFALFRLTFPLLVVVFFARVSTKLPRYRDTIKVRDEYVLYLKACVPLFCVYVCLIVVSSVKRSFAIALSQQFVTLVAVSLSLAITVMWAPLQFSRLDAWQLANRIDTEETTDELQLSEILSQTDGFRAFMDHVFAEFSYENLLCSVELLQFQKLHTANQTEDETHIGGINFQFPEEIMELSPTISSNESESFEQRFLQLSDKYLSASASMPVNLSSGRRQQLEAVAEELRTGETERIDCAVFDEVLVALFRVMSDSYSRFTLTTAYKTLVKQRVL